MTSTAFFIESVPPVVENAGFPLRAPVDVEDRVHGANADKLNANRTDRSRKMHSLHLTIDCFRWVELRAVKPMLLSVMIDRRHALA